MSLSPTSRKSIRAAPATKFLPAGIQRRNLSWKLIIHFYFWIFCSSRIGSPQRFNSLIPSISGERFPTYTHMHARTLPCRACWYRIWRLPRWWIRERFTEMDSTGEMKYSGRTKTARGRNPDVKSKMDCDLKTRLPQAGTALQPNTTVGSYTR